MYSCAEALAGESDTALGKDVRLHCQHALFVQVNARIPVIISVPAVLHRLLKREKLKNVIFRVNYTAFLSCCVAK